MKFHWDAVQTLAKTHTMEDPTSGLQPFIRFLQFWWCQKYNRPLKDPMLAQYTINELLYEYLRYYYTVPENDPRKQLEAKKVQADEDAWIREQLSKVQEAVKVMEAVSDDIEKRTPDPQKPLGQAGEQKVTPPMPNLPEISTKFDE